MSSLSGGLEDVATAMNITRFVQDMGTYFPGIALNCFEWVSHIPTLARDLAGGRSRIRGEVSPGAFIENTDVYISPGAIVEPGAYICGPTFLGPGVRVRHGAYVRGGVIMLHDSVLGHASEAKDSIFCPGAKAPHFAYVGNSILGEDCNLGAGVKLSNLQVTSVKDSQGARGTIKFLYDEEVVDTHLTKFGAIIGDRTQIGCNAVLNPGVLLGRDSLVYPGLSIRSGIYANRLVHKLRQEVEVCPRT